MQLWRHVADIFQKSNGLTELDADFKIFSQLCRSSYLEVRTPAAEPTTISELESSISLFLELIMTKVEAILATVVINEQLLDLRYPHEPDIFRFSDYQGVEARQGN